MITTVRDNKSLAEAIAFLENKQHSDLYLLKEHFEFTKEQLNPINIVKEKIHDAISSPGITGSVVKGAVGLMSGFLAKRFMLGSAGGVVGKLATPLISGAIMKNLPDNIPESLNNAKDSGISLLQKGLSKLKIK